MSVALNIIVICLLTVAAVLIIFCLGVVCYRALSIEPRIIPERLRFKQREKLVGQIDVLIASEKWDSALKIFKSCFYLDAIRFDAELVEKVNNHHQAMLSRLIIIAEKRSSFPENIAVLEDLLLSRSVLLRAWFEANLAFRTLSRKRLQKTPGWALKEYEQKLSELEDRVRTNQRSISSQLDIAIEELANSGQGSGSSVIVH